MSDEGVVSWSAFKLFVRQDFAARRIEFNARAMLNPVARFTLVLRLREYTLNRRIPVAALVVKIWFRSLSLKLGFSIPPNVFGPGLCIVHYGTIIVNPAARVGTNCRLHACVNIGGKAGFYTDQEAAKLCPTIGNNCYIGPGAKIFGSVVVADDCTIGANAVVTKSFPTPGVTIVGIPARVLSR